MTPDEGQAALDKLRADIDELDLQLLALFNARAQVVEEIGDIKRVASIPIYEPKREELVFSNVLEHNRGPLPDDAVRRLYERIIDEMRSLQRERMRRAQRQAQGVPQSEGEKR
ncbi:MAG: chorismate mutase [Bryobacteraceae bacterium]